MMTAVAEISFPNLWLIHCVYIFILACTKKLSTAGHTHFSPFQWLGILPGVVSRILF